MRPSLILFLVAALSACSQFPELDATVSDDARDAPFPDLVPIESLTARIGQDRITPDMPGTVEARAEGLRSQAGRRTATAAPDPARVARLKTRAEALRGAPVGD